MNDSIPTPLTDGRWQFWREEDGDDFLLAANLMRDHARDLERQLTISRQSCAVLQAELDAQKIHRDAWRKDCAELNARLVERTQAFNDKDRRQMRLLSKTSHELWKTGIVNARMKALLEDVEAAGRPHSCACECPTCEAWEAIQSYLSTVPAPAPK